MDYDDLAQGAIDSVKMAKECFFLLLAIHITSLSSETVYICKFMRLTLYKHLQ